MAENIVPADINSLIEGWLEAERNGNLFPVPFELATAIAGYTRKDNAKRTLRQLKKDIDFSSVVRKNGQRGRSSEIIHLSCDAMKHFCLMAETSEGEAIRGYFIECEKKWRLVQQVAPQVASDVELLHLQIELAKIEAQKEAAIAQGKQADLQLIQFRHIVTTTMPEVVQQKVLGYSEVKTIEYRDRIIQNDDIINDGSTALKTELCQRYGLRSRTGKPNYKALNELLEQLPAEAFRTAVRFQENNELLRHWLPELDRIVDGCDRNRWLGE